MVDDFSAEYKEKLRYILCLKNNGKTIYRIIHRVGVNNIHKHI